MESIEKHIEKDKEILQDPTTKNEGLELLENILSSNKLSKEDRELIERLLLRYEN